MSEDHRHQGYYQENIPRLSNDVLSAKDATSLAIAVREAVLVGKTIHPVEVERLCCFIIKRNTLEPISAEATAAGVTFCCGKEERLTLEIAALRNVVQRAMIAGCKEVFDAWNYYFPDKPMEPYSTQGTRNDVAMLRAALVGLIGADTEPELRQMEAAMRLLLAPDADKAVSINAIHALLATMQPSQITDGKK